jgi:hypothetical protein
MDISQTGPLLRRPTLLPYYLLLGRRLILWRLLLPPNPPFPRNLFMRWSYSV